MLTWDHVLVDVGRALRDSHPAAADDILRKIEVALRTPKAADAGARTARHVSPPIDDSLYFSIEASLRACFPDRADYLVRKVHQALRGSFAAGKRSPLHGRELITDDAWLALCPALTVIPPKEDPDVARLVIDQRPASGRQMVPGRFLLEDQETMIGRSSECHISIREEGVSRAHVELYIEDGAATICDLRSCNGTHLLRRGTGGSRAAIRIPPLSDVRINHGDCIAIGRVWLYFSNPSQD